MGASADLIFMHRAVALARRGRGSVEPNPMVGCVLTDRQGRVLGEGFHRRYGGYHAEVEALHAARRAGRKTSGATAYVTLEPCCHHGKQPPCTEALLAAGIRRVVMPFADPFPQVAGGGIKILRAAGVQVEVGCGAEEVRELLAPWLMRVTRQRPWVIAKWAQSLDGRLATPAGDSQWISGPQARQEVHRLRGLCDAVIVGGETLRRDDPHLLPRFVRPRRWPVRVVVSSSLNLPLSAKLFYSVKEGPVQVWTTNRALRRHPGTVKKLQDLGVAIMATGRGGKLSAADLASLLSQRIPPADRQSTSGNRVRREHPTPREFIPPVWTHVLLEGGGRLQGEFLDAGLIDELVVFVAGILIGGHKTNGGLGLALTSANRPRLADCPRMVGLSTRKIGQDWLITGRLDPLR